MNALKYKYRFEGTACVHTFNDGNMITVEKSMDYEDLNRLSPEPYTVTVGIYDPICAAMLTHEFSAFEAVSAAENWIEEAVSKLKGSQQFKIKKSSNLRIIK